MIESRIEQVFLVPVYETHHHENYYQVLQQAQTRDHTEIIIKLYYRICSYFRSL